MEKIGDLYETIVYNAIQRIREICVKREKHTFSFDIYVENLCSIRYTHFLALSRGHDTKCAATCQSLPKATYMDGISLHASWYS